MNDSTPDQDLGPDAAERLLDAAAHGDAPTTHPLGALLTAATTPNHDRALAGEEAALAHFRATQQPTPDRTHGRALRTTATAILIALGLSGIAVAADTARPQTPSPHPSTPTPTSPNPHNPPSPTSTPHPSGTHGIATRPATPHHSPTLLANANTNNNANTPPNAKNKKPLANPTTTLSLLSRKSTPAKTSVLSSHQPHNAPPGLSRNRSTP